MVKFPFDWILQDNFFFTTKKTNKMNFVQFIQQSIIKIKAHFVILIKKKFYLPKQYL